MDNSLSDTHQNSTSAGAERQVRPSLFRGFRKRCPNCGSGPLMKSFLTVRDHCPVCDQELSHHKADDGPAYLTILLTGHMVAPLIHIIYSNWQPDPIVMATGMSILAVLIAAYLLPRIKGAIVGYQWAKRMYGFAKA